MLANTEKRKTLIFAIYAIFHKMTLGVPIPFSGRRRPFLCSRAVEIRDGWCLAKGSFTLVHGGRHVSWVRALSRIALKNGQERVPWIRAVLLQQEGIFSQTHVIFCPFLPSPTLRWCTCPFFWNVTVPPNSGVLCSFSRPRVFICLYAVMRTWREEGAYW